MKKGFLAIIAIAAISIATISCDWFGASAKTSTSSVNSLIGEWKIDSVQLGKDTSLAYAFLAMALDKDSGNVKFQFTKDTIFYFL